MAETELDLETGRSVAGGNGDGAKSSTPRRRRSSSSSSKRPKVEVEIESRLERILSRLAELREGRGDDELAGALREDTQAIAGSIVSVTKPFGAPARRLVLTGLAVAEPLLAFGRIGRILAGRLAARRERLQREREAAAAEYDPAAAADYDPAGAAFDDGAAQPVG